MVFAVRKPAGRARPATRRDGARHVRDRAGGPTRPSAPRSSRPSARSSQREVIPVAAELERTDTFPDRDRRADARRSACSASPSPRRTAGSASTCLTYIGVIEELAYGWMSLTGIVNTHTMAATLILTHGTEEQKQRWLPAMASGRAPRRASRCPSPTPAATRATSRAGPSATATSTSSTAPRPGSPTASGPPSWRWPPGPRRASPPSSSRRSPARASRASR